MKTSPSIKQPRTVFTAGLVTGGRFINIEPEMPLRKGKKPKGPLITFRRGLKVSKP